MATIAEYLQTAQRETATHIYFSVGSSPLLKIDGKLKPVREVSVLNKADVEALLNELLSPEKILEFRARGALISSFTVDGTGRLRLVITHGRKGPLIAVRLLPSEIPRFESLGLPQRLKELVSLGSGLVLVMGPSKSGKTTTLASLVEHINETSKKSIVTVEMPLEYQYTAKKSLIERFQPLDAGSWLDQNTLGSFLKTVDVMVIDGLSLEETISPALTAAAEGLLVLASLETNGGVAEILARIIQTCPSKARAYRRMLLARVLKAAIWQHLLPAKNSSQFIPLFEFLLNDPVTARLINQKNKLHLLRPTMAAGRTSGMQTMHQAIEVLKEQSIVGHDVLDTFEHELLRYYISPTKANF
jgi:twitching motility protein PilT